MPSDLYGYATSRNGSETHETTWTASPTLFARYTKPNSTRPVSLCDLFAHTCSGTWEGLIKIACGAAHRINAIDIAVKRDASRFRHPTFLFIRIAQVRANRDSKVSDSEHTKPGWALSLPWALKLVFSFRLVLSYLYPGCCIIPEHLLSLSARRKIKGFKNCVLHVPTSG